MTETRMGIEKENGSMTWNPDDLCAVLMGRRNRIPALVGVRESVHGCVVGVVIDYL